MSFNGAVVMLLSIAVNFLIPQLIANIGSTKQGWTIIALIFAVPCTIIGLFRFIFIKEVVTESTVKVVNEEKDRLTLKKSLHALSKNKYVFILAAMTFVVQLISNLTAVNNYYFKYIFGNIGMASIVSLSSVVTPLVLAFFPLLSRKFGTVGILKIGAVMGVFGYIIRLLGGTNLITIAVGSMLGGLGIVPVTLMISIYLIDCMDYGEWKTGVRVEGLLASVNAFMSKLGSGVSSALVGLVMGAAGYDGNLAVQSASANNAIVFLFNWLPMIGLAILVVLGILYKLDKELPTIKADLEKRHAGEQLS